MGDDEAGRMTDAAAGVGGTVTVTKRDWRDEPVYAWRGDVYARDDAHGGRGTHVALRAVWRGPGTPRVAEGVVFEPGDVFYEHYYDGAPYGLWQVLTPDEQSLKCWYCNISTPAELRDDGITFRDLLLDVLLLPDGRCAVLDRDDLARALAEGLDPALAEAAERAAREVLDLIARRAPPFEDVAPA